MALPFAPERRAVLVGLNGRADLNGVEVRLLYPHADRWAVTCTLSQERIRVKPVNLALCEPARPPW